MSSSDSLENNFKLSGIESQRATDRQRLRGEAD
jgi:hypothetical protein